MYKYLEIPIEIGNETYIIKQNCGLERFLL